MRCAKCGKSSSGAKINKRACWQRGLCGSCDRGLDKLNIEQRIKSHDQWIQKYEERIQKHKEEIARLINTKEKILRKQAYWAKKKQEALIIAS